MLRWDVPRIGLVTSLACAVVVLTSLSASASLIDFRSTPDNNGIHVEYEWGPPPDGEGFRVDWVIGQNPDSTWHYKYWFSNQNGTLLTHRVSHFILQLSENIESEDLFNFTGDVESVEFDTFGPSPGNPGFPEGESIFGIKLELTGGQTVAEFDSTRQPMWGDFHATDGGNPRVFAYNTNLGIEVANPNEYNGIPVDATGSPLHKVLVPDTFVPEPATLSLLGLGVLGALVHRNRVKR